MFLLLFTFCFIYTQIESLNQILGRIFYIDKKKEGKSSSASSVDNKTPATSSGSNMLKGQGSLELCVLKSIRMGARGQNCMPQKVISHNL
jgi:hypothetical protein